MTILHSIIGIIILTIIIDISGVDYFISFHIIIDLDKISLYGRQYSLGDRGKRATDKRQHYRRLRLEVKFSSLALIHTGRAYTVPTGL